MPPNVRESPLTMFVTLHPVHGFQDARAITLRPGVPCMIGRASKSNNKNLEARRDNALFDCPVISREHAELRAHLWDLPEDQITIMDKASMHGTKVNGVKLREGVPKTLRNGDTIQFGERVTRGESSHEGVIVTFSHPDNLSTQASNTLAAHTQTTKPSGVYRYPYTSEEDSDYSDDNASMISDREEVMEVSSSAKTTPEHAKATLGSQELPIELDRPELPKRTVVQDSLDAEESMLVRESLPVPPRRMMTNFDDVESDSDDESAFVSRDKAPSEDLEHLARISSVCADVQHGSDLEASEHVAVDQDEEPDEEEEEEQEDNYRALPPRPALSPVPAKEASPELPSSGPTHSSTSLASSTMHMPPPVASNSYTRPPNAHSSMGFVSQPVSYPDTYTPTYNSYPGFSQPAPMFNTRASGVSRWDKLPTGHHFAPVGTHAFHESHRVPSLDEPNNYVGQDWPSSSMLSATGAQDAQYAQESPPPGGVFARKINSFPPVSSFPTVESYPGYFPQSPKMSGALATPMPRISIPDIVEEGVDAMNEPRRMMDEARSLIGEANAFKKDALVSSSKSSGTKRKALDETDDIEPNESESAEATVNGTADDVAAENVSRAQKRIKLSEGMTGTAPSKLAAAGTIAGSIAKYAAVASAGGAGMLAFLCSPASEQLLNWLS